MFNILPVRAATRNPGSDEPFVVVEAPLCQVADPIPNVFKLSKCNGLSLFEATVDELQHHFSSGSLTSAQYVTFCLENIRKVGHWRRS